MPRRRSLYKGIQYQKTLPQSLSEGVLSVTLPGLYTLEPTQLQYRRLLLLPSNRNSNRIQVLQ